jgi:hypothetical protein
MAWLATSINAQTAPPIRATIAVPKTTFAYGEQIAWTLTLTNVSGTPIRIMKPEVFVSNADPRNTVEFLVDRPDGRSLTRMSLCLAGGLLERASVENAIVLEPHGSTAATFDMFSGGAQSPSCWSFESESGKIDRVLPAGKYAVRLKYAFPPGTKTPRWSDDLSRQFGEPWHGDVVSNTIAITIKK